jgi:hypothetical protein
MMLQPVVLNYFLVPGFEIGIMVAAEMMYYKDRI